LPCNETSRVFAEPWQAQAFALAVQLSARGHFSWSEWSAALGEELRANACSAVGDPESNYYRCWVTALERLIASKGIA
jgi:nitrile hydratase accessory protein